MLFVRLRWFKLLFAATTFTACGMATVCSIAPASAQTVALKPRSAPRVVEQATVDNSRDKLYEEVAAEYALVKSQGNLLKKVVQLVKPTVVHIESYKTEVSDGQFGSQPTIEEAGSGIIIKLNREFFVITNRHVIADTSLENIKVRLSDGRHLRPLKTWTDADTDVAVIRVRGENIVSARLGNSDQVEIGDFVVAVGSPFGLSHSVTYGIISAKGRRDLELGTENVRLQDFLQTDAAINPGNSGGPLLNLRGEVIGINTAIASNSGGNEGVSFAIPIRLVMFVAEQLIVYGEVSHAYLGVQLDGEYSLEKAQRLGLDRVRGALVKGVTPRSPAFFSNLQVDDLITTYDGIFIEDDDHLVNLVSMTPINQTVSIDVVRNTKLVKLNVKVANRRHFEPVNR
ncbi:MAG: trypsin-like peptidase domain-containing protein [Pirellulaceae bacterium]|nr:trypsin-like peptidase domain-containing protein [Pirellulaceae bacterium]